MCVVLGTQQQVRRVLGILLPRKSIQYPRLYRHKKQPETALEYDHASVSLLGLGSESHASSTSARPLLDAVLYASAAQPR